MQLGVAVNAAVISLQLFVEDIVNERAGQPVQVVEPTVTVEVAPPRKKS